MSRSSSARPLSLFFSVALVASVLCVSSGCSKQGEQEARTRKAPPQTLHVVTHSSLEPPVEQLLKAFLDTRPADAPTLQITQVSRQGYDDAIQIAHGEQKPDLWISASQFAVEWSGSQLRNLGAAQRECLSYGESPISLVTTAEFLEKSCAKKSDCLWESVLSTLLAPPAGGQEVPHTIFAKAPQGGPAETLAWSTLFYWSGEEIFSPVLPEEPRWRALHLSPLPSYETIFRQLARFGPGEYGIATAPKSVLLRFQATPAEDDAQPLIAITPADFPPLAEQFLVCTSAGDWVDPKKLSLIAEFRTFLSSETGREILTAHGFSPLDKKSKLRTVSETEVRDFAEKSWKQFRRPVALLIALDTSASLEEEGKIYDARRFIRTIAAEEPEDSLLSLLTFSSNSTKESEFHQKRDDLLRLLEQSQPIGGGTVFDALVRAYEKIEKTPAGYRRRLVFLTDGGDLNSRLTKEQLLLLAKRQRSWRTIDTTVIGLQGSGSDLAAIQEITTALNGRYLAVNPSEIDRAIPSVVSP
ncbi:VWA domain-containing protein [bacterium]|nr:VWA domain-containing protein [bacterium]